jgi:hypothetical protein
MELPEIQDALLPVDSSMFEWHCRSMACDDSSHSEAAEG